VTKPKKSESAVGAYNAMKRDFGPMIAKYNTMLESM
jgi:hypothetical protein